MKDYAAYDPAPRGQSGWMPAPAPLPMPVQSFAKGFRDPRAPGVAEQPFRWALRAVTLFPALMASGLLLSIFADWMSDQGFTALEWVWLFLIGLTFFWISFVVSTSAAGLWHLLHSRAQGRATVQTQEPALVTQTDGAVQGTPALRTAILIPIYNESPVHVFGNAAAMLDQLRANPSQHSFELFVLSDTQNPGIAAREEQAMALLRATQPPGTRVFYRRRARNTDRKTGNLRQWITTWGGAYDAMLVLDADSLMDHAGLMRLTDTLAADPSLGLVQSNPSIFGATTLFGRLQQFASAAYGPIPGHGLAALSGRDGNFIGHNGIVRVRAFADCAGLPRLRPLFSGGSGPDEARLILSHDFVEAALLRRAGWGIRVLPDCPGSFEETPMSLMDYIRRDRRWCQGNMQHLRVLAARGLHPMSRYHMFHNALAYLMSPAWFGLVAIWALIGVGQSLAPVLAEPGTAPVQAGIPEGLSAQTVAMVLFVYGMLILPKLAGAALVLVQRKARNGYGGAAAFARSATLELLASILIAPIMMVQQTTAIVGATMGKQEGWGDSNRYDSDHPIRVLFRFHRFETTVGAGLMAGILFGITSPWLLPIALSLTSAVLISALSTAVKPGSLLFATPTEQEPPVVVSAAFAQRRAMARGLETPVETRIAAE